MPEKFANNASSTLASGITNVATACSVQSGEGALWPTLGTDEWCWTTITDGTTVEIVKVTARASDAFTIERGQQGTLAQAWSSGATVQLRLTRDTLTALQGRVDYITNSNTDHYLAQGSTDLEGDTYLWAQVIYRRTHLGAPANIIGKYDGTGGWAITDEGYNYTNASIGVYYKTLAGDQATIANVNGTFDRHWVHVGFWVASPSPGAYEATVYINGTQRAGAFVGGAGGFIAADLATLFQVGSGDNTLEIAGFAYRAGSGIGSPTAIQMGNLFEACYEANDVVAGGLTWDYLFSVKHGTPGATWDDSTSSIQLDRVGSPTVEYKARPLWL